MSSDATDSELAMALALSKAEEVENQRRILSEIQSHLQEPKSSSPLSLQRELLKNKTVSPPTSLKDLLLRTAQPTTRPPSTLIKVSQHSQSKKSALSNIRIEPLEFMPHHEISSSNQGTPNVAQPVHSGPSLATDSSCLFRESSPKRWSDDELYQNGPPSSLKSGRLSIRKPIDKRIQSDDEPELTILQSTQPCRPLKKFFPKTLFVIPDSDDEQVTIPSRTTSLSDKSRGKQSIWKAAEQSLSKHAAKANLEPTSLKDALDIEESDTDDPDAYPSDMDEPYDDQETQEANAHPGYQGLQSLGDASRIQRYLGQFATDPNAPPRPPRESSSRSRFSGFKRRGGGRRRGFKKRSRIQSMSETGYVDKTPHFDPSREAKPKRGRKQSTNTTTSIQQQSRHNYYKDDPGFEHGDFSMQWEGISGVVLD